MKIDPVPSRRRFLTQAAAVCCAPLAAMRCATRPVLNIPTEQASRTVELVMDAKGRRVRWRIMRMGKGGTELCFTDDVQEAMEIARAGHPPVGESWRDA